MYTSWMHLTQTDCYLLLSTDSTDATEHGTACRRNVSLSLLPDAASSKQGFQGTTASSTCTDAEQHGDLSCFPMSSQGADDAQVAVQIARAARSALLHECLCRAPWLSF